MAARIGCPHRRSPDHLRRAPAGRIEAVARRACSSRSVTPWRLVAHARRTQIAAAVGVFVLSFQRLFPCQLLPLGTTAGLSVFFPAYNDSGTIASMVIRTVKAASELTPDFEIIVVDDGSADGTAEIADELARTYPQVRAVHHPHQPRLRRRAADRLPVGDQGADLLHRRRRAIRPGRAGGALGEDDARRRSRERLQDQPRRSAAPHRHRPGLSLHRQPAVRPEAARRRLRFPADAAHDLRPHQPREDERHHLRRDDEEDPGCRLPRSSRCRCITTTARSASRSSSISGACSGPAATCCSCGSRWSSAASTSAPACCRWPSAAADPANRVLPDPAALVTRRLPRRSTAAAG